MTSPENEPHWERQLLEKLSLATLQEQRVKRRWGIFFKLLGFSYLVAVLVLVVDWDDPETLADGGRHTALVHLSGTISSGGDASAESITEALRLAFSDKGTAGVVLRVNSPGGSPVQAGIVHDEIRRLRSKHPQISLYAVVEDLCASGGYYVAVAADQIFVDKASIVGSIGVLMDGFGFTGTMDKLGIERRLLTAGVNKGFLDPFSPQDAEQKNHAQVLLGEIHSQFIEVVRKGRGTRLKETPEMFTGLMWTGTQSVKLGLADGFGTVGSVARDVIKAERIVDFTVKENLAERFAKRLRADATHGVGSLLGAIDWPAFR
ncbi:MAG: putative signal peptide peptidase SppA [Candidatus Accumulibacter appositus]|uniref:Putative signal peptide peptidase SppA n=1 Tax=Candidatus Accumulibacter appositus TaxID=1454003 RepID=A0A011P3A5_9PROT|nr:S49 family peptidase [Accumulibacter sp.]EXI82091.1 MAG: putative signal peptide peptidase SppA [Candidatus Accumulibacter appositus]HRF03451.1 S49 family peptidase [Accumulibacter sp.]